LDDDEPPPPSPPEGDDGADCDDDDGGDGDVPTPLVPIEWCNEIDAATATAAPRDPSLC